MVLDEVTVPSGEIELVVVWLDAPVTVPSVEVTVLVVEVVSEPDAQATSVLARAIRAAADTDWTKVVRETGVLRMTRFLYSL